MTAPSINAPAECIHFKYDDSTLCITERTGKFVPQLLPMAQKVQLYIYDLTMGMAAQLSPMFLGKSRYH